jgi:hypothetical protein
MTSRNISQKKLRDTEHGQLRPSGYKPNAQIHTDIKNVLLRLGTVDGEQELWLEPDPLHKCDGQGGKFRLELHQKRLDKGQVGGLPFLPRRLLVDYEPGDEKAMLMTNDKKKMITYRET